MLTRTAPDSATTDDALTRRDATNRKNILLLIQLRWIAVVGQIGTIAFAGFVLDIDLPLRDMSLVLLALVALNLASALWVRDRSEVSNRVLLATLLLDVLALSVQLHFSGGATNPFAFLYLLQITLAAVLLGARSSWAVAALACVAFAVLMVVGQPLRLPEDAAHLRPQELYVTGALVCLLLDASLLVGFLTRIGRNLRERDQRLAALKQRAVEEDHIVRMGLLASGAAHELGTPLASLAVILNDWQRMPVLQGNAELAQELAEMQAAVQRCKTVVTRILLSSGEARGEAPSVTSVNQFLDGVVAEWRKARSSNTLHYENEFGRDVRIVSDSVLNQVLFNLLDNAFEASPDWLALSAEHAGDALVLEVADSGPGFAPAMLAHIGKPYQSTKGRQGGGLGLFLVVNVVRKLGGEVGASNRDEGGAVVTVTLPLSSLALSPGTAGSDA